MTVQFSNTYLEKLFQGKAVPGKPKYGSEVIAKFKKTVLKLQYADSIREIKTLKWLNFEALRGDLKGYHSVRVDRQYRLILTIGKDEKITFVDVITVHDLSNHYQ